MRISAMLFFAIPAAVAIACGGGTPEPTTPTTPSASAAPTDSAAPSASAATSATPPAAMTAWKDDAPIPEQAAYMKANVMPVMGKVFADHDAKKYGDTSCKLCHGPNKENPHKFLPKLKLSGDGFQKLNAEKPDVVKFMHEQVEPQMAKAMGQQPYDMKTNTGFGCKGCHAVE